MTNLRTAAQQALEALEHATPTTDWSYMITALRSALAQQAEPDHETRAELAEQQVVQLAEERDHYRNLWQKAQQAEPVQHYASIPGTNVRVRLQPEPASADPHTTTLRNLLECCLSWEPDACVLGNVTARQAVAALRAALAQQAEPLNLADPAVQKRLASQWGYVPAAAQAEPVQEPVAWECRAGGLKPLTQRQYDAQTVATKRHYTRIAPPRRTMVPLTEEEILAAVGWERAAMYMKLAPNFPVDEAKKETLTNARAVEKASWEKNHG